MMNENGAASPQMNGQAVRPDLYGIYNNGYSPSPDDPSPNNSAIITTNDTCEYQNEAYTVDDADRSDRSPSVMNMTANSQHELIAGGNVTFHPVDINDTKEDVRDCGLCGCRPVCMQVCANIKLFIFVICIISMFNGSLSSGYLPSVITSIERRFELGSSTSGLIAASYEFGSVVAVIFVSYFGGRRHIPRWIGCGAFFMGLGALLFSLPHFVAERYTVQSGLLSNVTDDNVCRSQQMNKEDVLAGTFCTDADSGNSWFVFNFILSQLLIGIGSTPIFTLGTTYVDNHVTKAKSPALMSFLYATAAVGPVVGFGLGALMLQFYVDIFNLDTSSISSNDPQWVGAWWGGFLIIGCGILLTVIPIMLFPKTLHKEQEKMRQEEALEKDAAMTHASENSNANFGKSVKDIPSSILQLLKNPIYMLTCLGVSCESNIVTGFILFLPKYLETQFIIEPWHANLYTGGIAVPGAVIGILLGGYIMFRCKLNSIGAIQVTLFFNILAIGGMAGVWVLGCDNPKIAGGTLPYYNSSGYRMMASTNLSSTCNMGCDCSNNDIQLICGSNGMTYFSPCHAGCTSFFTDNSSLSNYTNCACIGGKVEVGSTDVIKQRLATEGPCKTGCETLIPFMVLLFFMCMFVAATQAPLLMVTMRSVSEEERAFCLGMQFVILRFLAYIPAPILFGAIIDEACMFWKNQCGTNGSCLLYNIENFRFYYIGTCAGYKVLAAVFFVIVWIVLKVKQKKHAEFDFNVPETNTSTPVKRDDNVATVSATFSPRDLSTSSFQTMSSEVPSSDHSDGAQPSEATVDTEF